ncbi:hypothetical protein LXA43DRAFT_150555 [Ganoderma leucocontextum]|nr:hypothetical protein LXA43DRAFT_150555 [Ganoderma leucocontextum]
MLGHCILVSVPSVVPSPTEWSSILIIPGDGTNAFLDVKMSSPVRRTCSHPRDRGRHAILADKCVCCTACPYDDTTTVSCDPKRGPRRYELYSQLTPRGPTSTYRQQTAQGRSTLEEGAGNVMRDRISTQDSLCGEEQQRTRPRCLIPDMLRIHSTPYVHWCRRRRPRLWDTFGGTPRCRWAASVFEASLTDLGSYLIIGEREERAYLFTHKYRFGDDRRRGTGNGATPLMASESPLGLASMLSKYL